ncbi:MAG: hypothetical protein E6I64_06980 [Chloroflexi bacterium]|nr:MAG: hypothetical protein E6I64_06980 [Chloroflexota bacterium]
MCLSTNSTAQRLSITLQKLLGRLVLCAGLALALGIVAVSACSEPQAQPSPSPARSSPAASRPASPIQTPLSSPTATAQPTVSPIAQPGPGSSPAAACAPASGGTPSAQAQLVALRVAHQSGFDRVVFEFAQSTAPGPFGVPTYSVEPASSLSGPSGQPVQISGNALFGIRFQNASTRNPDNTPSYGGAIDLRPTTPLVKEIRLVEDFERVLTWGAGLDHLVCPKVSVLSGPFRVVLDFPTPP